MIFIVLILVFSLVECMHHEGRDFPVLFCFVFYWQYPNPYNSGWTHSRLSRSIRCVNNWMKSLSRRLRINFDPVWVISPSLKLLPWLGKWCSYWLGWSKCMIDPPELHGLRLREDDSLKLEVCYLTRIREWASKNNSLSTFKIFDNLTFLLLLLIWNWKLIKFYWIFQTCLVWLGK